MTKLPQIFFCGSFFVDENHVMVALLNRSLAMSRQKNGLNKEQRELVPRLPLTRAVLRRDKSA